MKDLPKLRSVRDCAAFAKSINPKKEPLTIEKLRTFPGCENYSDEEAAAILLTIAQLTHIMFELQMAGDIIEEQPGIIIRLNPKQPIISLHTNTKAA